MAAEIIVTTNEFAEDGARSGIRAAIVQTMVRIRGEAVERAPFDTSYLKNSIMWRKGWGNDVFNFRDSEGGDSTPKIDEPPTDEGVVGTAVEYGTYQEFGTRFMRAHPYMRPAGDAIRGATASEIAKKWGDEAMAREFKRRRTTRKRR